MEKCRVWLKGWVVVETENADEAITEAFDNLAEMAVTDYLQELFEEEQAR